MGKNSNRKLSNEGLIIKAQSLFNKAKKRKSMFRRLSLLRRSQALLERIDNFNKKGTNGQATREKIKP